MRSCAIEIRDILTDNTMEMAFTQNEDMIEAFASHTAQEAQPSAFPSVITDRIGLGCLHRRFEHLNLTVLGDAGKTPPILLVIVSNQKAGSLSVWCCLSGLLGDPDIARRAGHSVMHNLARSQFNDEIHKHGTKKTGHSSAQSRTPRSHWHDSPETSPRSGFV